MRFYIIFLISAFFTTINLHAFNIDSLKTVADRAYAKEDFEKAEILYKKIIKAGESPVVCYNLGNCYYRKDEIAKAILWYERASLLSPGDEDIKFNLDMARSKTIDRITPKHEFFFVLWYRQMVNWMSSDAWSKVALASFILLLCFIAVYIYGQRIWIRKTGLTMAVIFLLITVIANIFAWSQNNKLESRVGAIVMASSAVVKSTPAQSGSDLFVLHEGTYVNILDNTLNDWVEITLADGKQGWIEKRQIEVI